MMTYQQAAELHSTARSRQAGKPIANNTRLFRIGDDYVIVLHSTAVVTIHEDGSYTLRAGGWRTLTTKDRICKYGPRVYQRNHEWFLSNGVVFFDGMRVDATGNVLALQEAA